MWGKGTSNAGPLPPNPYPPLKETTTMGSVKPKHL
jgi:hypothetical protein